MEFIGNDSFISDSDDMILAMEKIINLDPSVLELVDLPLGWAAYREGADVLDAY